MKIEMGESIIYSWLRHVKGCEIVQNNWKVSPGWPLMNGTDLQKIMDSVKQKFSGQYNVFKKNTIDQFLSQGECDAIGTSFQDNSVYGVDVAFHRGGLLYGSRQETVSKVIEKCIRTAMCMLGYLGRSDAEIVFVSPKVGPKIAADINAAINTLKKTTDGLGYHFSYTIIMNDDFKAEILDAVILASNNVDDTAELFMRSYQMIDIFYKLNAKPKKRSSISLTTSSSAYSAYRIGQLAYIVLRDLLEKGKASATEVLYMQDKAYSKSQFDLQYPLLVKVGTPFEPKRYYASPIKIGASEYYMCSQWFETKANNDRPLLESWINSHL